MLKTKTNNMVTISAEVDIKVNAKLKRQSKIEQISKSALIRQLINAGFDRYIQKFT